MAKSNQLNVPVGVDTKAYKAGWEEIVKVTISKGEQTEKEAEKMVNAMNQKFSKLTMKQQIRQMENLAAKMEQTGLSGTKAFGDVIKKSGELKAAQSDLKDLIDASRPDAPFKAMQNALQGGANAFAGVQGAMALFGAESEDTQKALLKVQAAMAFAQGFEAIDQLSDSFKQLNLVIKANPLIAVTAAIAALSVAVYEFNSVYNATADITDKVTEATEKSLISTKKERLELDALWSAANDEKLSKQARLNAINKLNEEYPQFHKNLSLETLKTNEATDAHRKATEAIIAKAKAAAVSEMITDLYKKEVEAINDLAQGNVDYMSLLFSGSNAMLYLGLEQKKINGYVKQRQALEALYTSLTKVQLAEQKVPQTPTAPTPKTTKTNVENSKSGKQNKAFTPIEFNDPNELYKNSEQTKNILAEQEIHWFNWATAVEEANQKAKQAVLNSSAEIMQSIEGSLENTIISVAEAIGSGLDPFSAFLTAFAESLSSLGKLLVAQGIALKAVELSIDPTVKIIAGAAAIVAGAAIKANLNNTPKAQKFASGGMVNSPTFAMVGDNLNAHNNPEFIMRRDQLGKLMNNNSNFEPRLIPVIDAKGISILVENGNRMRNR